MSKISDLAGKIRSTGFRCIQCGACAVIDTEVVRVIDG